jgi:carbon storage regulator CsrA
MLVLTRRPGEQIVIGNNIRITVVSLGPGRVKIGIEAPPDVRIDRQEIHDRIVLERERAADVLATVGTSETIGATQPIIVGNETTKIHNRIADALAAPAADSADTPVNRIARHRLPRKPR